MEMVLSRGNKLVPMHHHECDEDQVKRKPLYLRYEKIILYHKPYCHFTARERGEKVYSSSISNNLPSMPVYTAHLSVICVSYKIVLKLFFTNKEKHTFFCLWKKKKHKTSRFRLGDIRKKVFFNLD